MQEESFDWWMDLHEWSSVNVAAYVRRDSVRSSAEKDGRLGLSVPIAWGEFLRGNQRIDKSSPSNAAFLHC